MESEEQLLNRIQASFDKQAFLTLLGVQLEHVEKGKVVISCNHKETLTQQQGLIHGGVVTSLADVSCGYATLTTMPDNAEVLTVEFKINLIRPANTNKIIPTGKEYDCVSRSFAPKLNVSENPVCGSGHCHIIPFWVDKLKKGRLVKIELKKRVNI